MTDSPKTTTLIGLSIEDRALDRRGLSVAELAANKLHDLRTTSAFWLSYPLATAFAEMNIGQVAL